MSTFKTSSYRYPLSRATIFGILPSICSSRLISPVALARAKNKHFTDCTVPSFMFGMCPPKYRPVNSETSPCCCGPYPFLGFLTRDEPIEDSTVSDLNLTRSSSNESMETFFTKPNLEQNMRTDSCTRCRAMFGDSGGAQVSAKLEGSGWGLYLRRFSEECHNIHLSWHEYQAEAFCNVQACHRYNSYPGMWCMTLSYIRALQNLNKFLEIWNSAEVEGPHLHTHRTHSGRV